MGGLPIRGISEVVVTNNSIYSTGLGIFVRGGRSSGNRISDNTITAGTGFAALGICYNPTPSDSHGPRGDLISGNVITSYPTSLQFSPKSLSNVAMGNSFIYITEGFSGNTTDMDVNLFLPQAEGD